jgi:hypothetical protein
MVDKAFFNGLANGKTDIIQKLFDIIAQNNIAYCVIGGLAVNAYVEPVVSLDMDIVVATSDFAALKKAAAQTFEIKEFPHSINLYRRDSDLRIQVQTDDRYQPFVPRAEKKQVLGYEMRVASLPDVLQGKIWAYSDTERRKSKRQKDLADIFRIIEAFPELESVLPDEVRGTL